MVGVAPTSPGSSGEPQPPEPRFRVQLTDSARRDIARLPDDSWSRSLRVAFQRLGANPVDGPYRVEAPGRLPFKDLVPGERFFRYAYGLIVIDYSVFEQFDLVVVHRIKPSLSL